MSTATIDATVAARPRRRRLGLVALGAVALLVMLAGAIAAVSLAAWDARFDGRILPGVHVGTADLSGLARDDAVAAVSAAYPYGEGRIVLRTPDGDVRDPIRPPSGDVSTPTRSSMSAMASGRETGLPDRLAIQVRQALDGRTIAPVAVFDEASVAEAVRAAVLPLRRAPVNATIAMGVDGPLTTPARAGRSVDPEPVVAAALAAIREAGSATEVVVDVPTNAVPPTRTDEAVERARIRASRVIGDVAVTFKDRAWKIKADTVRGWISFDWQPDGSVVPVIDTSRVEATLNRPKKAVLKPALEAEYLRSRSGRIVGVVSSRNGRSLDVPATVARIGPSWSGAAVVDPEAGSGSRSRASRPRCRPRKRRATPRSCRSLAGGRPTSRSASETSSAPTSGGPRS